MPVGPFFCFICGIESRSIRRIIVVYRILASLSIAEVWRRGRGASVGKDMLDKTIGGSLVY